MAGSDSSSSHQDAWARFRFSVVGPLLSSPPPRGDLEPCLQELSRREWQHPTRPQARVRFAFSTIQRWYYTALSTRDPIHALRPAVRRDAGRSKALGERLVAALRAQYRDHRSWSYRLHHDNLEALVHADPTLGPLASYPSLVRFMKAQGLCRERGRHQGNEPRPGLSRARDHFDRRECRSFEASHVGGLWHLDFHTSRHVSVLRPDGTRKKPHLLAVLDDRSRLCCHLQFYLEQNTETLVHAFSQALLKRGLPRALMSDNGGEMIAAEFVQGLERLSIVQDLTLPYSPHQNGKQEHFWAVVEGRLLALCERIPDLSLERLNAFAQAWVERDYHHAVHCEIHTTPLDRFVSEADVLRPAPSAKALSQAFRQRVWRQLRRSDGTLTLEGVRFEIPSAFHHVSRLRLAYARWDLGHVHLVDPRSGKELRRIFPLDRERNASGQRRRIESPLETAEATADPLATRDTAGDLPPLLQRLVEDYAASGLPPAYLAKSDPREEEEHP